ncbi:MAG TPA: HEAT repeat domain-containing protein [Candidatus Angelobacter sp.]|jgi:HEAT repeat protein|nr:HEAT repeat domain-containing protein [Candidatus Angelobacter sp.]
MTLIRAWRLSAALLVTVLGGEAVAQQNDVPALLQRITDPDVQVRRDAAHQIAGAPSFPLAAHDRQIFAALNDQDAEVRAWIASAIMDQMATNPDFSQTLLRNQRAVLNILSDSDDVVRELAVKIVFFIRPGPPSEFLGPLTKLLSDPKGPIRRSALAVLAQTRPFPPQVRLAFLDLIARDSDLKAFAIHALNAAGISDSETMDVLERALHDQNSLVKQEAIKGLARIGHPASKYLDALRALAADPNSDAIVKDLAQRAIKAIE